MGNVSRDNLRKSQKEMLEIKNIVTEMKNVLLDSLVDFTRLRKESVSSEIEIHQTEIQRKKIIIKKNKTEYPRIGRQYKKV